MIKHLSSDIGIMQANNRKLLSRRPVSPAAFNIPPRGQTVNATWISACEIGFIVLEQLWGRCKCDGPPLRPSEHCALSTLRPFLHHTGGRALLLWILKSHTCNLGQDDLMQEMQLLSASLREDLLSLGLWPQTCMVPSRKEDVHEAALGKATTICILACL